MKTALVTGASKGLGRGIAESFSERGFRVIAVARPSRDLDSLGQKIESADAGGKVFGLNLLDVEQLKYLMNNIEGTIDVVVHNLGGSIQHEWNRIKYENLADAIQLNLQSGLEINNNLVSKMNRSERARIIHISSMSSLRNEGSPIYGIAKASLNHYVREFVRLNHSEGICANAILPGILGKSEVLSASEKIQAYKPVIDFIMFMAESEICICGVEIPINAFNVFPK